MKKKSLLAGGFMLAMVAATGGYHAFTSNFSLEENLLMENVEALSNGDATTENTGPGQPYKCPNKSGEGKWCLSTNRHPCTETSC